MFARSLGMATASQYEWKGVFYMPEPTYKWGAEKVSGAYVDPTMTIALIPVSEATEGALAGASGKGAEAMSLGCEDVNHGGTMTPAENKCYKLVFDQARAQSLFTIDASAVTAIAFFAQHLPTEFEATEHYLKDKSGVDIEPVAQDPVPGADGHAHGHGGPEAFKGNCVCKAKEKGWRLDCTNKAAIQGAVTNLDAKEDVCKAEGPPEDCVQNYHVMQAHHDHCLHDALPTGIEKKLHDYEHFYDDCFVKRQFDPTLGKCPAVDCSDAKAMTQAIATLQTGCTTTQACADPTCAAAIKTVLMAHDVCPEENLPNNLEVALHDHEEPCEAQLCNTAEAAFDPYADPCGAVVTAPDANAASRFGSQESFLITTLAFPLAVVLISP
jgi:hypothetical protein